VKDKVEERFYFLLRLFRVDKPVVLYAYRYRHHREWGTTDKRYDAAQFQDRSEARAKTRTVEIKYKLEHGWLWEVVRVDETIVTSYKETFLVSNAPPLITLARTAV
jgi:hypothetical protein